MEKPEFTKGSNMQDAIQTTAELLEYHRDNFKTNTENLTS